jgi:hypothetical protein
VAVTEVLTVNPSNTVVKLPEDVLQAGLLPASKASFNIEDKPETFVTFTP